MSLSSPPSAVPPGAPHPAAVLAHGRRMARQPGTPWLHGEVARRMAERLAWIRRQPQRVLEIEGCSGASLPLLQAAYPGARFTDVEPCEALRQRRAAELAGPRWARWLGRGPVQDVRLDDVGRPLPGPQDLVWSNLGLHRAADPAATLARWRQALAPDGFLMFSTFGPDTLMELSALYRELGWPPPVQRFLDMHDLGDAMVQAGYADPVMGMERLSLSWATAAELLAELRSLGGNTHPERHPGLRTPRWRQGLLERLDERLRGADGRLALSFEIVHGHAFQALPRADRQGVATVSVESLKASAAMATRARKLR